MRIDGHGRCGLPISGAALRRRRRRPQLCECGAADACAELVTDGGASWPFAGRTEDHRAVLELRAHRCAPQRIILTLPLGVGCSRGFPGEGISRPLARARVLCAPSPAATRITTPARSLLALHPRGRPDLPALCAFGTPDVGVGALRTTSWPSSACSKCQDSKQFMIGAQHRIAAAAALQTEAVLRAVSGARDGPLEKARARQL